MCFNFSDQKEIMKKTLVSLLFLPAFITHAQKTLQEKLGFSKDTKLLILHADDLGMSHSENSATIDGMEHGSINSASMMVPTPWFSEMAAYARAHPVADPWIASDAYQRMGFLEMGACSIKIRGAGPCKKERVLILLG